MYLQLDTKFNPFTYDEMVKPLLYYKQAYDQAEAAYSDLATQTEAWKDIANKENSPEAYEMYQRYSSELNNAVDDFSKGMTLQNRRALLGLKKRYASDIQPIANAHKRRSTLAEEQRKAELANPTMLWQRKASGMSLDDFIKNPDADYGRSVSGAALSAQVAAGASALSKEFRDNPDKMIELLGGDYYEYVRQRGFSSEAILTAISNKPEASPILIQLVESVLDSAGLKEWADPSTLSMAYNYARQGLWSAVGQDDAQIVQNWRAAENLNHSHAMEKLYAANKNELEKSYLNQTNVPYLKSDGTVGYYQPITKNSNGTYSRTPVPTDAIVGDTKDSGKNTPDTPGTGDNRFIKGTDITYKQMRDAMFSKSQSKLGVLGYSPKYSIAYTSFDNKGYKGNNGWTIGMDGEDHPGITGWAFNTNSNLINAWGNFVTKPINGAAVSWVEDINTLPAEVYQELLGLNIPADKDFQVQRVKRDGINEGIEYDYLIYVRND